MTPFGAPSTDARTDFDRAMAMRAKMTPEQRDTFDRAKNKRGTDARYRSLPLLIIAARVLRGESKVLGAVAPFDASALARRVSRAIGKAGRFDEAGLRLDRTGDGLRVIAGHLRTFYPDIFRGQASDVMNDLAALWDRESEATALAAQVKAYEDELARERAKKATFGDYPKAWALMESELLDKHVINPKQCRPSALCWACQGREWSLLKVREQRVNGEEAHLDSQWPMSQLTTDYRGPGMNGGHRISRTVTPAYNQWLMASEEELRGVINLRNRAMDELFAPGAPQPVPAPWYDPENPTKPRVAPVNLVSAASAFVAAMRDL